MAKGRDAEALMNREVLRFLVAGTAAAGINWAAGMALARAMPFEATIVLAYLIGMASGFTLYKLFVFPPTDRPLLAQVQGFAAVNLGGIVLVWVVAGRAATLDHARDAVRALAGRPDRARACDRGVLSDELRRPSPRD